MAQERKQRSDDKGPDQSWLVTFSDCMTLLLCFFVLLLTFSSFDEIRYHELAGALQSKSYDWIEENPRRVKDSIVKRPDRQDPVQKGSDVMTDIERSDDNNKPPIEIIDTDLYKDRMTFYLPSRQFFMGHGFGLTGQGKEYLQGIALLLREHPCRVVVGESSGSRGYDLGLQRSWSIISYLTRYEDINASRCSIAGEAEALKYRFANDGVIMITLMNMAIEQ